MIIDPSQLTGIYPIFYLLAVYTGFTIVVLEVYKRRLPLIPFLIVMVWGLIFAIIGSKLFTLTPVEFFDRIKNSSILSVHERVYIGWLIGGMIGIKIFRKILGFKFDLFDIFAFALPAGFALMRIGCLFGGCCFGKPANLPWAIVYAQNSPCYDYHLYNNLLKLNATISLPVHPAQIYEIIAMIIIILLLLYITRYLKKPGSLGYSYLVLHSIFRFFIDFTKEGGTYILGLKSMQWFLLFVIPAGILFILWRERNCRLRDICIFEEKPFLLNFILYLPAPLFLLFPKNWLTPAEFKVLLISNIIVTGVFVYRVIKYLCRRYRFFIRIPVAIASITVLEASLDTTITKDTLKDIFYIEIDGGYMKGAYREICGGLVPYDAGGMGVGVYDKAKDNTIYGINLRGYVFNEEYHHRNFGFAGNFILNHRYIGFDLGAGKVFQYYNNEDDYDLVYPSLGLRLGPRDKAFVEGEFLKHKPSDLPMPVIKLGFGFGTGDLKNETHFRFGLSLLEGFYASPVIYLFNNQLRIAPYFAGGTEGDVYQINLDIGYRYYFKD
ncbi:MAG: prolipoprotein diacylglyceryl transferase family protein [candidate division WOR-3 bacterium]